LLTAFLVLFLSASAAHGAPTILHHDLSVVLHPESNTMSTADIMQIRPDGASRLSFTLAKDALVSRLSVDGKDYPLNLLRDYATLVPPELDFPLKEFTARVSSASRAEGRVDRQGPGAASGR
jgi:hypothetical protein